MQSGTVDGLYYEVHGGPAADRATVILSAGLGGSGAFWAPQMEALRAASAWCCTTIAARAAACGP
jgi:pimeloyl-ACP methyl ester carboxylesterase